LTNKGAGLDVQNTIGIPETVDLTLDAGHSIRRSRLVWRRLNKTGVEFL
jgi:hypothetical protein